MTRLVIVQTDELETRAAILENGQLMEVFWETNNRQRLVGNIYKGRVTNVLPGMQAAFVDIGLERNAFLFIRDVLPSPMDNLKQMVMPTPPIRDVIKPGQELLVQVLKDGMGSKGPRVTCHLTIPGRWLVLLPGSDLVGVSRRIKDPEERQRLRELAGQVQVPGMGLIIRTAMEKVVLTDLVGEAKRLQEQWRVIQAKATQTNTPGLLHRDSDLVERILRDVVTNDTDQILVNDRALYAEMLAWVRTCFPQLGPKVQLREGRDFWTEYNLQPEIEKALRPKVWLKSGGYLVIEETEALTVIDVNTGKYTGGSGLEETVRKTNLEAVREICRQLRLRNIGGIIVIDFIDMSAEQHRLEVVETLQTELWRDRVRTNVLGITQLGLVEMTRKKESKSLAATLQTSCPYCAGKGRVLADETVLLRLRRTLTDWCRYSEAPGVLVRAHPRIAARLTGDGGVDRNWQRKYGRELLVIAEETRHPEEFTLEALTGPERADIDNS